MKDVAAFVVEELANDDVRALDEANLRLGWDPQCVGENARGPRAGRVDETFGRYGKRRASVSVFNPQKPSVHALLGYRQARLIGAGPLGDRGVRFRGHEFHYATTLAASGEPLFARSNASGDDLDAGGLRRGTVMGSFIHLIDRAED